jgi:hypothetical protein
MHACAWEPGLGDYPISFFNPELQNQQGNYPFYLSEKVLNDYGNYGFSYEYKELRERGILIPEDTNVREWMSYFKGKASFVDVDSVIYGIKYDRLNKIVGSKSIPTSLKENKCLGLLMSPAYSDALKYVLYAKECEELYKATKEDEWGPDILDTSKVKARIAEGLALYKKLSDNTIKLRAGYQLVKLSGMIGDWKNCIGYSVQYVESSKVSSTLKNWALLWKATALVKSGKKTDGYVLTANVFEHCVEKRPEAYMSLEDINGGNKLKEAELNQVILGCKNDNDRADIMAMWGLQQYYPCAKCLKGVYQYNPNHPMMENLIIREVNKLEDKVMAPSILASYPKYKYLNNANNMGFYPDSVSGNTRQQVTELAAVIDGFINEAKIQNKALLHLVKGYLQLLQGNAEDCVNTLNGAKQFCSGNKKMETEMRFLNMLCHINECKKLNSKEENELYPDLLWMEDSTNPVITSIYRASIYRILAHKYIMQDDYQKAVVCVDKASREDARGENDMYMDEGYSVFNDQSYQLIELEGTHENLKKLYEYLYDKSKSDYDKLITSTFSFDNNRMLDFEGTLYLREYNYEKATEYFGKISPDYWKQDKFKSYLNANPFYVGIGIPHTKTKGDTVTYNKYTFCIKMQELEKKANKDDPQALFEYANGLYNMTFDGNSWLLVADSWSVGDQFDSVRHEGPPNGAEDYYGTLFPTEPFFYHDYAEGTKAKEYYMKTIKASKDKELQARCYFLLAQSDEPGAEMFDKDSLKADYAGFETLRTGYANTKFYAEITQECSYFKDYIAYKSK